MMFRSSIPLAALALLVAVGCKKEETTPPDGEVAVADEADAEDDEADAEEADAEPEEEGPAMMNKASFDETIHDHFNEISDCYLAALEGNAELAGTINAEFTFDAEGAPTLVAADGSTLMDEGLVSCIGEAAKGWDFGVPKEAGMKMNYPIKLEPAE